MNAMFFFILVPLTTPSNVTAYLASRYGKIIVSWNGVQANETNGNLFGYNVHYSLISIANKRAAKIVRNSTTVSKYGRRAILRGFPYYAKISIRVAAATAGGEGPLSAPFIVGKFVLCLMSIRASATLCFAEGSML